MTINIYVVNNSISYLLARNIAKEEASKYNVLITLNDIDSGDDKFWSKTYGTKIPSSLSRLSFISYLKDVVKLKKNINDELERVNINDEVILRTPNIHHIVTNYLFFSIESKYKLRVIYDVLCEGTLNYVGYNIDFRYLHKHLIKKIIGKIIGLKYTIFFGDFSGADQKRVRNMYVPYKNGFLAPGKKICEVDILNKSIEKMSNNKILVLGQYLYLQIGRKNSEYLNKCFVKYIEETYIGCEIIYKGHPLNRDVFLENRIKNIGGHILETKVSAEEWLETNPVSDLIGISSTTIMMSRLLYGDNIRVKSFGLNYIDRVSQRYNYKKLKMIFKNLNIECEDLNV